MKLPLAAFFAVAASGWVAIENASAVAVQAAELGPDTQVGGMFVFQIATLVAASAILLKLGGLLRDWRQAIDAAVGFGAQVAEIAAANDMRDARLAQVEKELVELRMLQNELERRLGGVSHDTGTG